MKSDFLKIIITRPDFFEDEVEMCRQLLEIGACDFLHLRKPGSSLIEYSKFLASLPENLLHRVRLHDHYELSREFPVGGVQLNSRNNSLPPDLQLSYSRSCHTLEEVEATIGADYVTLSPIYDSISKAGYKKTSFDAERLKTLSSKMKIIALGGVEPSHFNELKIAGFSGAALLGYVWNNPLGKSFPEIVDTLKEV